MNVSGEFTVNAPRERVFETIRDPRRFVSFVGGVHDLKELDPTRYEAMFETKIAYLRFKFAITVEVIRIELPGEIEAKIEGVPLGIVGRLVAKSTTKLTDVGATTVSYSVDSTLTVSSAASGSPCCEPRPRKWNGNFETRRRAAFDPPRTSWSYDPV
jgi:carbon monoxide dehydrogenase subunit G